MPAYSSRLGYCSISGPRLVDIPAVGALKSPGDKDGNTFCRMSGRHAVLSCRLAWAGTGPHTSLTFIIPSRIWSPCVVLIIRPASQTRWTACVRRVRVLRHPPADQEIYYFINTTCLWSAVCAMKSQLSLLNTGVITRRGHLSVHIFNVIFLVCVSVHLSG